VMQRLWELLAYRAATRYNPLHDCPDDQQAVRPALYLAATIATDASVCRLRRRPVALIHMRSATISGNTMPNAPLREWEQVLAACLPRGHALQSPA